MRRFLLSFAVVTVYCLLPASSVSAHPLDVGYLDFGKTAENQITLTVAVHPYQAFELVRKKTDPGFDLTKLQNSGDLVSAYIQDHVSVWRGGSPCTWDAGSAHTPPTELEALGDGVTVAGVLTCNSDAMDIEAQSTMFLDGFPTQTAILRLELPDGYADRLTLDKKTTRGKINLSEMFVFMSTGATSTASAGKDRRPDAAQVEIAMRFLDSGLGFWGAISLLLAAVLIGALHALGPGHGKSLMAAMLVGEKATFRNLFALGTVMTVTHVSDVFLMALGASFISSLLPPTELLHILEVVSAVGLVAFGLYNLVSSIIRYRLVRNNPESGSSDDAHARAHALGLPHAHGPSEAKSHDHADLVQGRSFRQALWMGFVGSLAPCPTAWAIFMGTLSAGRPGAGAILLVAFTVGLYATILCIGILVLQSQAFALKRTSPRLTYALPIVSACVVTGLGAVFILRLVFP